jgi:light-regulated signal transduction histidine kinase (bacteriophytochrome)
VLRAGTPVEFEETVPHGDEAHTYVAIKFPLAAGSEHPYALCSIATDITGRKRMEGTLAERTRALERANSDLEAFNYSVSHDLRAPLRAIDGFARILAEDHGPQLDDEAVRALGMITDGAHRMSRLIDDLLKFARCGRQGLERLPVDLTALVESVSRELRLIHRDRSVTLTILPLPAASADPGMLRQVLINLMSNAWKFTANRPDGTITVGATRRGDETVYYVQDNGAGFDMTHAPKLFGVFQRLHSTTEFDGTGIGLAIVRRIVERHGGLVWAEGRPREGATFYFTLPNVGAETLAPA